MTAACPRVAPPRALSVSLMLSVAAVAVPVFCGSAVLAQQQGPQQAGPQQPAAAEKKAPAKAAKAKPAADKAQAKADPANAQSQVEAGVNALEAGKVDVAVASLSSALSSSSLPATQTARALYYRGIAYRRQSKPALAISDLTSALWLKGALNEQQRADAMQHRAAAYREAGLPDQTASEPVRSASTPNATTAAAAAAPASTSSSGGGFFSSLFGGGASTAAPTPPAPPPVADRTWGASTQVQTGSVATAAAVTAAAPAVAATKTWAAETTQKPTPASARAAAAAAKAAAAPAPTAGAFRLQVAAVRTPDEANGVAAKLQERYGRELGGRAPAVDQTVMANMGTIYRVKVGPYANASEPKALCDKLKADGMDCLVVSQ